MRQNLVIFLQGLSAAGAWAAGVFFLRFWYESRDRLFAFFAAAFWLMALSWSLLGALSLAAETRPYVYGIRLIAFLLIIIATIDKNRVRA